METAICESTVHAQLQTGYSSEQTGALNANANAAAARQQQGPGRSRLSETSRVGYRKFPCNRQVFCLNPTRMSVYEVLSTARRGKKMASVSPRAAHAEAHGLGNACTARCSSVAPCHAVTYRTSTARNDHGAVSWRAGRQFTCPLRRRACCRRQPPSSAACRRQSRPTAADDEPPRQPVAELMLMSLDAR